MKKITLISAYLSLILFSQIVVFSQGEEKATQWTSIKSRSGDLAFSVPQGFLIDNEDGNQRAIACQNKVTININIETVGDAPTRLAQMRKFPVPTQSRVSRFTLGKFVGDVYTFEKTGVFSMSIYAASPKEFYTITTVSNDSTNSVLTDFLNSIRLADRPLLKQATQFIQQKETEVSIDSLGTSPVILEALKRKPAKKAKITYELNSDKSSALDENAKDSAKYSRSLIILRKPRPSYTDSGRSSGVGGIVKLKALFHANGDITDIVVLNKLGSGLDDSAADALRKVKFLPAEIDGKPIDAFRIVEYSFTIY